ncbi:MAG: PIG-L deacetylase family protein [Candidatus Woesearchaeota archaeon]
MDNVIVICAHSDDQIFGPGGTLAKFAKHGMNIYTVIFSFGELSHPWFKQAVTSKMRIIESKEADKIINGKGVFFLGLDEGKFEEQFEKDGKEKLLNIIKQHPPKIIFTHSEDDPLKDHRSVNKIVKTLMNELKIRADIYSFDVWNIFDLKKDKYPKFVVDISDTFSIKIAALKVFKSQFITMLSLLWSVYLRAFINGIKYKKKFVEVFYKIK